MALRRVSRCRDSAPEALVSEALRAGRAGAGRESCCLRPSRPVRRCDSGDGELRAAWSALDCETAGVGADSTGAGTGAGGVAGAGGGESLPRCAADESGGGAPMLCGGLLAPVSTGAGAASLPAAAAVVGGCSDGSDASELAAGFGAWFVVVALDGGAGAGSCGDRLV